MHVGRKTRSALAAFRALQPLASSVALEVQASFTSPQWVQTANYSLLASSLSLA